MVLTALTLGKIVLLIGSAWALIRSALLFGRSMRDANHD